MKTSKSTLMKPATNEKTERCSFCGKPTIVRRGPIRHCTACGKEEGTPKIRVEYDGSSRGDLLK